MRFLIPFTFALGFSSCSNSGPNHLGNPLLLPIRAISSAVENSFYDSRRNKVERFVEANFSQIKAEVSHGGGATLSQAMDLAKVPEQRRPGLITELHSNPALYSSHDSEPMVVAMMVHGSSR